MATSRGLRDVDSSLGRVRSSRNERMGLPESDCGMYTQVAYTIYVQCIYMYMCIHVVATCT